MAIILKQILNLLLFPNSYLDIGGVIIPGHPEKKYFFEYWISKTIKNKGRFLFCAMFLGIWNQNVSWHIENKKSNNCFKGFRDDYLNETYKITFSGNFRLWSFQCGQPKLKFAS